MSGVFRISVSERRYPVLQREDHCFVDVEFDCDFRFAGADVAVGTGRVQDARDQQLFPEVGTLVQEDLDQEEAANREQRQTTDLTLKLRLSPTT